MKSKALGLLIVMVMVVLLAVPVGAAPAPDQSSAPGLADAAPSGSDTGVYIVRLEGAALSSYEGGIAGLEATSPAATGEAKLDVKSPASVAYLDYLAGRHDQFIAAMEQTLDRSVEVLFRYDVVLNGMAVRLSAEEAARVAALPGVVDVQPETIEYPDTDVGPTWIGAPGIWSGSAVPGGIGTHGEGVIVGMLDTGINHDHPSFADVGDDGYNHTNPWGANNYVGYCVTDDPTFCNDKLIGAWSFVTEAVTPEDSNGHGSHTASTAAGNVYNATKTTPTGFLVQAQISGVAPHANVIMYDVCTSGCPSSSSVAAVNQAVADGVDVINFSISGGNNPYGDSVELAFLDANTAGVFVSTSAGNNGPGASTVAHRSPWVSTVAASTHNRLYTNQLINMTGGTTPPADITGQSISTGYGPAPIVYAGDYGNALCAPFGGVIFSGEIVVCDRGTYGRVEKGQNVLNAGGGGYILANDAASGDSLVADPHVLPATHITYSDGVVLKAWLAAGSGHQGTITTTSTDLSPINGDIMASFSSRGPNTTFDVLKPDMTAPGVAIFAAYMNGIELEWLGGTSMSSPHNAGAGALMKALYPSWTPSEIKSAIMTTSWTDNLRKEDGVTPADAFDVGAGRDNLMQAALAGIVFDETRANYQAANPALGGDPKTLNMPSFQNNDCEGTCTWTRVVSSTQASTVSWTAADSAPGGVAMTVEPATFDLPAGGTQLITVTADVTGLPIGVWAFDEVTLTPAAGSPIPEAHLPVAVVAQPAAQPPVISVDPESFDTTQAADTVETYPLTVTNSGGSDLTWSIYEAAGPASGATRLVDWSDDFDSYATDLSLHGVGGWKGWGNSPAATAYTRDEQAISTPNSVEIVNVSDLVHEYTGVTSGVWTYTAWQYIPAGFTGESYFILLNQYDDAGTTNNWSTQVDFNGTTNTVVNDGPAAGTLPLVRGQWMEIRVEIDLDNDTQSFYYGGDLLFTGSWTDGMSGGGILNVAAVDLWGNNASAVYYDDLSLVEFLPSACDVPSDIPWASVAPTSGTTLPGADSMVDVTFDTTGLTVGATYSGTLCVDSNDPTTPLVAVPLSLTVTPYTVPPTIVVDPESYDTAQQVDTQETYPLTVTNTGENDLNWSIYEDDGATAGTLQFANWSDDFDSYATDLSLHGVGGWKGWGNSPAATAYTRDEQAISTPNSVEIVNVSDLVHEYTGVTSGLWTYTAWQYIPAGFTGESYFILLNQYDDAGATNNWSTQVDFNGTTNTVVNDGPAAGTLPLVRGQWMEIRVEIDLDNDVQSFYYGGDLLFTGSWTDGLSGGGILNVAAVDLWGNNASAVYYDDLSLVKYVPPVCDVPSEIPWVSVAPTSGTTLPGADSMVDVTFDTTGLTVGMAYTGTLCVSSNDPATPVVAVPLTLLVVFRDVELSPVAQTLTGAPGEIVTHTFTLTNTGLMTDTFELSVAGNNWPTSVAGSTGDLAPGEATTVDVAVTIPDTPAIRQVPIASDSFTLTAASMADDDVMAQAVGTTVAEVNPIVDLSADQVGYGVAGEQVSYVFLVTNNGDYTDTFTLELTGEVWTSTLSIADSGALAPGASQAMTLTVDIPADAVVGDSDTVTLVATSMLDPALSDSALATTIVQATPAVDLGADQAGSGAAGSQVTYVFLVTNSGDYTDTFTLELTGGVWASTLSITETAELAPGASQAVTLTVDIPTDAAAGATDVVTLTAISMLDPEVSDSATATTQVTTVQRWFYFVPIILKN